MEKERYNLVQKIFRVHGVDMTTDSISLPIDMTLTQDATGTMAYLELMNIGIDKVKTQLSVSYVDHNTLQNGFENADDHIFLQTVANKYGVFYSKAGNGICHQVQLERFTKPGVTLLGSDSHTPTSGALGAIAIGAGGLDVALAMAGKPFKMIKPKIVNVRLSGELRNGVTAKDVILEVLKRCTVKGGVNKIFEYSGEGVKSLSVCDRATICNMGAELGATTSIFPSDKNTFGFLKKQGREQDWAEFKADEGANYDERIEINLDKLACLAACPSQPDNVKPTKELEGTKINQVLIGSCTNSSYEDMIKVASILKGNKIHKDVSFGINPGSKQVLAMMIKNGLLYDILQSGARILECTCGPCIGMGQSPCSNGVSLRTYNRNFYGRSGTNSASVYLVSPVTAALSAIKGEIVDGTNIDLDLNQYDIPNKYIIDDSMIIKPSFKGEVIMGPNIMPLPKFDALPESLKAKVVLKLGDDITTDHIMPAGAKVLPFRSNIEKLSDFCFSTIRPSFKNDCKKLRTSVIVGGFNYGQGSSREHAAIAPRYLGVRVVLAKSFARIHKQNLINFGIVPIQINDEVYDAINEGDELIIDFIKLNDNLVEINKKYIIKTDFTNDDIESLMKGALLNRL